MAKTDSKRTLEVMADMKKEFDRLELFVLGDTNPLDAEQMLRVLRILNDGERRTDFLIHFVMEYNEGSVTITPPPPGKTDPPSPPTDGQPIIIEESEPTRQTRKAKKSDNTELLETGNATGGDAAVPTARKERPLTLSRGLGHRTDGVHVEVSPERRRTLQETQEDIQRTLAERRRERGGTG
jgi:hypothetical protein